MEYRINPHFKITQPTFFLNKPRDCKYYSQGQCIKSDQFCFCYEKDCETYISTELPQIITLCGSTRFKENFLEAARDLTLQGWIVLMPGVFGHADNVCLTEDEKEKLDELHLEKIRLSNAIFILNIGGYIGDSTKREIAFAESHNIPVYKYE